MSDLVEQARNYAKHDDYHVTRNYLNALCNEIERLRNLNKNVYSKITDDKQNYLDAERYRWLKTSSWEVPHDQVAPSVLLCNGNMSEWHWVTGETLDEAVDAFMMREIK